MTFLAIGILIATISMYLGFVLPYWITKLITFYEKEKFLSDLMPTQVDESRLCTGPHLWFEANSIDEKNEYFKVKICTACGFIPSRNLMTTEVALKRIKDNKKIDNLEQIVLKDFEDQEYGAIMELMKEEMKNGLTFDKINSIYHAGQTSYKRYVIYKIARSEELRREIKDNA